MENKKILVVEDETTLLKAIKSKLKKNSLEVSSARSVEGATKILKKSEKIDAIWLDHYLLGKEDGLDFIKKIKKQDKWKNIPVYVVSNTTTPEKVKSYKSLGIDKYYTKSDFRLEEIIDDILDKLGNGNSDGLFQ